MHESADDSHRTRRVRQEFKVALHAYGKAGNSATSTARAGYRCLTAARRQTESPTALTVRS
ncbi:hypothetical protein [Actinoplanes sp. NPDC026623]|uniref:hypothetical protein n=1 Tax=Actinoplanes sp. NPDC026623 TaxID=3155610 RepID=UPI0033CCA33B